RLAEATAARSAKEGRQRYDRAEAAWKKLIKDDPKRADRYRLQISGIMQARADLAKKGEDYAKAIEYHKKALAIREGLSKRDPKDAEYRAYFATSLNNLALTYKDAKKTRLA